MLIADTALSCAFDALDVKDPCPVFFRGQWHLYGSGGCAATNRWGILHWIASDPMGPWAPRDTIFLDVPGRGVAAPGVIADGDRLHMMVQTEYCRTGGTIEYLHSDDGERWTWRGTALHSLPGTDEAGIYDAHPALIDGCPHLTYSGFPAGTTKPQPDIYLARAVTRCWTGPWLRLGKILDHRHVADHHNGRDHPDYEWGLEGAQLLELPHGRVLLNAVCFLPHGRDGERQRVFFALADDVRGPYRSLGPVLEPPARGENGHATALLDGQNLRLFYQTRDPSSAMRWRYGVATFDAAALRRGQPC